VQAIRIVVGMHGDTLDATVGGGAHEAQRNLAAIGDEEAANHGQMLRGQTPILGRRGIAPRPTLTRLRVPLAETHSAA
jgi:hypothetical protein